MIKPPLENTIARAGGSLLVGAVTGGVGMAWGMGTAFTYAGDAISYQSGLSPTRPNYTSAAVAGSVVAGMSPLMLPLNTLGSATGGKITVGIYNSLVTSTSAFGVTAITNQDSSPDLSAGIGAGTSLIGGYAQSLIPGPVGKGIGYVFEIIPSPMQAAIEQSKNNSENNKP